MFEERPTEGNIEFLKARAYRWIELAKDEKFTEISNKFDNYYLKY